MIASVQYNDLRGTAAADIADGYMNSLRNISWTHTKSIILKDMFAVVVQYI